MFASLLRLGDASRGSGSGGELARGKSKDIVVNVPQIPEQTEEEYGACEDIEYTVEDHFGGRLDYVPSLRYTPTDGI